MFDVLVRSSNQGWMVAKTPIVCKGPWGPYIHATPNNRSIRSKFCCSDPGKYLSVVVIVPLSHHIVSLSILFHWLPPKLNRNIFPLVIFKAVQILYARAPMTYSLPTSDRSGNNVLAILAVLHFGNT